jgi:hypothetical protein
MSHENDFLNDGAALEYGKRKRYQALTMEQ